MNCSNTPKIALLCMCALLMQGCDVDIISPDQPMKLEYDFAQGQQNWQAGFADYETALAASFELDSGIKNLPVGFAGTGYMLTGHNRSDDLFMFLKRKISGLSPSTRYQARLKVSLLSAAGASCSGIGGAPGESVYLHFGFADIEPKQVGYTLNVAKGNQSQDGTNSKVQGNIAVKDLPCDGSKFQNKTLISTTSSSLQFTTQSDGSVWLFTGTDSGYEGKTTLYYQKIELELKPL
ncbi:MAG: hypothetical protein KJ930_01585 [Gammaproteobacteria bacterium]|nr:hypothetical protein [Gammaproteobacteria bacterium]MBU2427884.1 hypothetical protein [Gammaproteobacteria bacterium]